MTERVLVDVGGDAKVDFSDLVLEVYIGVVLVGGEFWVEGVGGGECAGQAEHDLGFFRKHVFF